jgi:hypothetical protein
MNEFPIAALAEALESFVRGLVREEVQRADREWRWRTPAQAGELLGISAAAVRQRVVRGQLPATKLEGRLYLDINDLDTAISNGSYHPRPLHVHQSRAGRALREQPRPWTQEG